MREIIGNTTATPNPRPDWLQTDVTKADYIKNKPEILTEEEIIDLINGRGGGNQLQADWNQTDETQLDYIKNKPALGSLQTKTDVSLDTDNKTIVGAINELNSALDGKVTTFNIPTSPEMTMLDVITTIQDAGGDITGWNIINFSGYQSATIGVQMAHYGGNVYGIHGIDFSSMAFISNTDDYSAMGLYEFMNKFAAFQSQSDESLETTDKTIVGAINEINNKLITIPKALSDLTDDAMHRVVTDAEKTTWNAKANTSDIPTKVSDLTNDSGFITGYTETDPTVPAWAKTSTKPSYTKSEVGLGNVDNVKQYSTSNPPPYPVTKVNNKTGDVTLSASDIGADASGTANSAVAAHNTDPSAHADIREQINQLSSEKVNEAQLTTAVDNALAQAKASGKFDGADGKTPYIQDGYWYIDGVNTNVKAEGKDGVNGETPLKGKDYWTPTDKNEIISEVNDNIAETLENLETLPYGGSKEWLDANGDKTLLYQIDGYVWGYVESNGWTKSATQFLVVSSENQMTNAGGTEYLLRSGNTGTVYSYAEASGDIGIPVYDSKPETANEGDIIAVGGRKYKASVASKQVLDCTNHAKNFTPGARLNSSGVTKNDTSAATVCEDYITFTKGTVVRVKGFGALGDYNIAIYSGASNTCSSANMANKISDNYIIYAYDSTSGVVTLESTFASASKVRISGILTGTTDDVVITVNEEIKYKTVTTVTWTDIGEYIAPVEAGWNATDETYSVIDALSATANSGDSAVYSVDGYVYAYIAGADWMQMSKYTPQTVDKQLSETSANAVQNKVVTAAINEVKETANANAEKIIDLQNKVEGLNGGTSSEVVTIPSYWETEVTGKTALVKELQTAGGKDCVSFAWASDTHIPDNDRGSGDTANTGGRTNDIGKVIAKMLDNCEIPFALITGDINTRASCSTEEKLVERQASIPEHLAPLWGTDRLLIALGNHDGAYGDSSGYYKKQFPPERMWQIFFRGQALDFRRVFSEDGLYYYVDNIPQKTRFIVLNSHFAGEYRVDNNGFAVNNRFATSCYGQAQLDWLANVALEMPEGYSAIITAHAPLSIGYTVDAEQVIGIINAYCNKTTFSGSYTAGVNGWSNSTVNVDFTNAKGDIVAFFAGHVHWDKVDTTTMARPIITIIAAGAPVNTYQMSEGEVASTRTFGTATETSFDVVTINKATRKIYCVRVGGAADRFENSTRVIDY